MLNKHNNNVFVMHFVSNTTTINVINNVTLITIECRFRISLACLAEKKRNYFSRLLLLFSTVQ